MLRVAFLSLTLLVTTFAVAQDSRVLGRVTDADTGQPIAGAHVFVAESMIGTTTNDAGDYALSGLSPGAQRIVVSIVGFEMMHADIIVQSGQIFRFDAALNEDVIELEGFDVVDFRDERWQFYFEYFERTFLGETDAASAARITNLQALNLDTTGAFLRAWSTGPLEITNPALGYELQYHLHHYRSHGTDVLIEGYPVFIELEPDSPEQRLTWDIARCEAYFGSSRHLLRSLASWTSGQEGFTISVASSNRALYARRLVQQSAIPEMRRFLIRSPLRVAYAHAPRAGEHESDESIDAVEAGISIILPATADVEFDDRGRLVGTRHLVFRGALAARRMADMLPYEYDPPAGVEIPAHCESVLRIRHTRARQASN